MTKNDKTKYKVLTDEDMKIIQSDPAGLADYIVRTKIKETKKTALIVSMVVAFIGFGAGVAVGMQLAKTSIPNNVVQVQVGGTNVADSPAETAETEEGK